MSPGGSCVTEADCAAVGGQIDVSQTCDCWPFVVRCGGQGIPANSPVLPQLRADIDDFVARGCQIEPYGTICDCAPSTITCENGYCVTADQSCLGP